MPRGPLFCGFVEEVVWPPPDGKTPAREDNLGRRQEWSGPGSQICSPGQNVLGPGPADPIGRGTHEEWKTMQSIMNIHGASSVGGALLVVAVLLLACLGYGDAR